MNETLQKLYQFAVTNNHKPIWIEPQDEFKFQAELSNGSFIEIQVRQQEEQIDYMAVLFKLDEVKADLMRDDLLFKHLLEVNANVNYNVIVGLSNDTVYLRTKHYITYDDILDKQLFTQSWIEIARFYEEKREAVLSGESQ
jgi:hypothetical protein